MHLPFTFMKTMFINGPALAIWITLLAVVNLVVPMLFIASVEGRVVLAAMMCGAVLQMVIFAAQGFVGLLGIGHVFWVPLLPWLWSRLDTFPPDDPIGVWIIAVVLLNGVSLVIDAKDVARYIQGERTPHLTAS